MISAPPYFLLMFTLLCVLQFSDIRLKAAELGICTFTGQWEDIKSNTRWLPKTYALFVILFFPTIPLFFKRKKQKNTSFRLLILFLLLIYGRLRILLSSLRILQGPSALETWKRYLRHFRCHIIGLFWPVTTVVLSLAC